MGAVVVLVRTSLTFGVPDVPDWVMPETVARLQLKFVPDVALVAVYTNAVPLHIAAGANELLSTGDGFTDTTTFCEGPLHPLAVVV